jgi:hypothetical protein
MSEQLTITLSDRRPVRVDKDAWPIIASDDEHDGQVRSQANRTWKLIVRQHEDGRAVVYGIHDTNWQGAHGRRGGELVEADGDLAAAIRRVGERLEFPETLIEGCIADLPAEDL